MKNISHTCNLSLLMGFALLLFACNKDSNKPIAEVNKTYDQELEYYDDEIHFDLESENYESVVVVPLEKPVDFDYYTKGIVSFMADGKELSRLDYGEGELDTYATKSSNGKKYKVNLKIQKKTSKLTKVIVSPLVKIKKCKYIVEGIIKYYDNGVWVATVDYGNGTCDDLATKTWSGGSKTINISHIYKKKR